MHGAGHDHNLVSAYLHVLADALTSVLAIVALLAAKYFGLTWMDPFMGLVGAALVARWSFGLLKATSAVLLDRSAAPGSLRGRHGGDRARRRQPRRRPARLVHRPESVLGGVDRRDAVAAAARALQDAVADRPQHRSRDRRGPCNADGQITAFKNRYSCMILP